MAGATATRAGDGRAFAQGRAQALTAHFHEAELADRSELDPCAILAQSVAQTVFHIATVARLFHVDEVDDDQTTQVAQTHLPSHFVGCFEVGARGSFFDVAALDGAGRVHVHRDQCLGMVDHNGAARGQLHGSGIGRFDLVLDLKAAEQRRVVTVPLHAGRVFRHDMRHELLRLIVNVVGIDQDVANVVIEIVTDGANHQRRLLVDQESALGTLGGAVNGGPQLQQVIQVPLQFGRCAADACGARNDAHAVGVFQLVHGFLELGSVIALDAAAHATATRVVGHQDHIATSQADESGQCRALVAALFLFDLHQQFVAFLDDVLDACLADRHALGKVLFGDFLERQEAVTVFPVVDKAGFQRRLDARDDGLVDVPLALFATFDFDFVVEQFLPVHNGQTAFFSLCGVDQHPLHDAFPFSCLVRTARNGPTTPKLNAMKRKELPRRPHAVRKSTQESTQKVGPGHVDGGLMGRCLAHVAQRHTRGPNGHRDMHGLQRCKQPPQTRQKQSHQHKHLALIRLSAWG